MRDILFRGRHIDSEEWSMGGYAKQKEKAFIVVWERYTPDTRDWDTAEYYEAHPCYNANLIEVDPTTVGQYTGLTDRNGIMIFEGDIVRASYDGHEDVLAVEWNLEELCSVAINGKDPCGGNLLTYLFYCDSLEVIGDVYNNSELLKKV